MSLKVIGSGVGRTGTHSLKLALEQLLGEPCYHMVEVFPRPAHIAAWTAAGRDQEVDWRGLFEGFAAAVDWPTAAFWPELARAFPDAIILHSERDPEGWWTSASATIFGPRTTPPDPRRLEMLTSFLGSRFTAEYRDREAALAAYARHNRRVHDTAPKDRLVVWRTGDGWEPICKALDIPVPATPFPHSNTTAEFIGRVPPTTGAPS